MHAKPSAQASFDSSTRRDRLPVRPQSIRPPSARPSKAHRMPLSPRVLESQGRVRKQDSPLADRTNAGRRETLDRKCTVHAPPSPQCPPRSSNWPRTSSDSTRSVQRRTQAQSNCVAAPSSAPGVVRQPAGPRAATHGLGSVLIGHGEQDVPLRDFLSCRASFRHSRRRQGQRVNPSSPAAARACWMRKSRAGLAAGSASRLLVSSSSSARL